MVFVDHYYLIDYVCFYGTSGRNCQEKEISLIIRQYVCYSELL